MPPSLGGTREWVSTRKPPWSSPAATRSVSSTFWKTPPERATTLRPVPSRTRRQAATAASASPLWNRAATTGAATPASRSATTARTSPPVAMRKGSPSSMATG